MASSMTAVIIVIIIISLGVLVVIVTVTVTTISTTTTTATTTTIMFIVIVVVVLLLLIIILVVVDKPMRIIVPSEPIHGWPKGFCYADFSERQHAYEICKASKVDGIFMMRRRLNFINQGVHYQYKDPAAEEAAKDEQADP
eukprot:s5615_g2.t1